MKSKKQIQKKLVKAQADLDHYEKLLSQHHSVVYLSDLFLSYKKVINDYKIKIDILKWILSL